MNENEPFIQHVQGIWLWTCPNCSEAFPPRPNIDMPSITRRHDFERKLGFEVDIHVWDSLCDKCQESFLWLASSDKHKCVRCWKQMEEKERVKRGAGQVQTNAIHGKVERFDTQSVVEVSEWTAL